MAAKDFGPIEADYAFFMTHATEAENDAVAYARELQGFADGREAVHLLDFGCGGGEFTERLLTLLHWPARALRLSLVEPVERHRDAAIQRLRPWTEQPIAGHRELPPDVARGVDVLMSNHVLYYVEDLPGTLQRMVSLVRPGGKLLLAIAGWDNPLLGIWKIGFDLLGRPVPYHSAEVVAEHLNRLGVRYRQFPVPYRLRFTDSANNRLSILRFLFGEYFRELPQDRMLREFEPFAQVGQVEFNTSSQHFVVEPIG